MCVCVIACIYMGLMGKFPISDTHGCCFRCAGVALRSSLDFFHGCWMISSSSKLVSTGARRFTLMPG